jgi:hypothetical protein
MTQTSLTHSPIGGDESAMIAAIVNDMLISDKLATGCEFITDEMPENGGNRENVTWDIQ